MLYMYAFVILCSWYAFEVAIYEAYAKVVALLHSHQYRYSDQLISEHLKACHTLKEGAKFKHSCKLYSCRHLHFRHIWWLRGSPYHRSLQERL